MLDNIEEACRNDFGNISSEFTLIKTSIETLRNEMIQHYAIAQRLQVEFDQANQSEASSSSSGSSNSSLKENRNHFKRVFDSNKKEGDTMDYAFETVRSEIHEFTGEKSEEDPKFRLVMLINRWVDSKEITSSLNNNAE